MIENSPESFTALPNPALQQTIRLLARLGKERFFGKLILSYESGQITYVRKEEVLKMTP
jgi:hypothetical protein